MVAFSALCGGASRNYGGNLITGTQPPAGTTRKKPSHQLFSEDEIISSITQYVRSYDHKKKIINNGVESDESGM